MGFLPADGVSGPAFGQIQAVVQQGVAAGAGVAEVDADCPSARATAFARRHFGPGRVTELRGPFGPGGALVYRVRYGRKPSTGSIEVLGNSLRLAEVVKRAEPEAPPGASAP
ncbi:MAG: hypothetical protein ACRC33_01870, partial [Gemmataceae bacterium]